MYLTKEIIELEESVKTLENENIDFFINLVKKLSNKKSVEVVFTGTLSNGKSSVINAILQENILQVGIGSTTAKITYITEGNDSLTGFNIAGESCVKELNQANIKELNEDSNIEYIEIGTKNFNHKNITFVDSPGINDIDELRESVSYSYVPLADIVVFVIDISKGFTADEKRFFDDKIIKSHKEKIFIILNGLDKVDGEDLSPVLNHVLLEGYKVFPLSAKKYLVGTLSNDNEKIEKSRFLEFLIEFNKYIDSTDPYTILSHRIINSLKSLDKLTTIQINTMIENINKSKVDLEIELKENKVLLEVEELKVQEIQDNLSSEISAIKEFVSIKLNELGLQVQGMEDTDEILKGIEKVVAEIITYSKNKLGTLDIDIGMLNTMLNTILKYFKTIVFAISYAVETYVTKNPSGKISSGLKVLLKGLKNAPFIKKMLSNTNRISFDRRIKEILKEIEEHFNQELTRVEKEKKQELEFEILGEIKSIISAYENSIHQKEDKKSTIENEISFFGDNLKNIQSRIIAVSKNYE
nr:dynamin family protein [Sulfurimonas sp. SAG-AH-194-C21]